MKLSLALQQAILARLRADAPLTALLGGPAIHDAAPHAAAAPGALPYITLGDEAISDWSSNDATGAEHRLTLTIWSDAQGFAPIKALMEALHAALDRAPLAISGGHLIALSFLSAETARTAEGRLRKAECRFRALVEHSAAG